MSVLWQAHRSSAALRFVSKDPPPVGECGAFPKPPPISSGKTLRNEVWERPQHAAGKGVFVIPLGSPLSFYPAANIPLIAAGRGVPYAIINRGPTEHDDLPEV